MIDALTWIGSIAFGICGLPYAWQIVKQGHANDQNWPFLLLWTLGEVTMLIVWSIRGEYAMLLNYILNFFSLVIVIFFKIRPRKTPCLIS